jgi:hypothetical protein
MLNYSITPWKTAIAFDRDYIRNIKDAQGEIIAQIPDWTDGLAETTANARLMAAAPDLLTALRDLLSRAEIELDQTATHDGLANCDALANCRAAIIRALYDQSI